MGVKFPVAFGLNNIQAEGHSNEEAFIDLAVHINDKGCIYLATPYHDRQADAEFRVYPMTDEWMKQTTGYTYLDLANEGSNLKTIRAYSEFAKTFYDVIYLEKYNIFNGYRFYTLYDNMFLIRLKVSSINLKGIIVNNSKELLDSMVNDIDVEVVKGWSLIPDETNRENSEEVQNVIKQFKKLYIDDDFEKSELLNEYFSPLKTIYSLNKVDHSKKVELED